MVKLGVSTERGGCHGSGASVAQHLSLTWVALILFIFKDFFLMFVFCESALSAWMYVYHTHVSEEGRGHQIPWNWSRREL